MHCKRVTYEMLNTDMKLTCTLCAFLPQLCPRCQSCRLWSPAMNNLFSKIRFLEPFVPVGESLSVSGLRIRRRICTDPYRYSYELLDPDPGVGITPQIWKKIFKNLFENGISAIFVSFFLMKRTVTLLQIKIDKNYTNIKDDLIFCCC